MKAGDYGDPRMSPSRFYRDTRRGKLMGVCAGIADYFGFDPWGVRLIVLVSLIAFTLPTLFGYFAMGILFEAKPDHLYANEQEEVFWRGVRTRPDQTARDIRHKFRELERRLRAAEAYVTSREFKLNREIRDLDA